MSPKRILVVDDEAPVLRALTVALDAQGYRPTGSMNGEDAVAKAAAVSFDLILLDLGLPGIDGFEVIRRIRTFHPETPILVVSAQGDDDAKVRALDLGGDDYVEKPFAMSELLARVRVGLRHADRRGGLEASRLRRGEIEVDLVRRAVTVRGRPVDLTPTQFDILVCFARHPGRLLTHRAIVSEVWGDPNAAGAESLRVHISQLRHRIEEQPRRPRLIVTDPGTGYRFLPTTDRPRDRDA